VVCGVIGTTKNDENEERLVPVTDCLLWLQDLQRALRRDDDAHRSIALVIGSWKIVQTKLLPLLKSVYYDSAIVVTILKILVILTKPLSAMAKRAARMAIDVKGAKNKKASDRLVSYACFSRLYTSKF
jgi:timeless